MRPKPPLNEYGEPRWSQETYDNLRANLCRLAADPRSYIGYYKPDLHDYMRPYYNMEINRE